MILHLMLLNRQMGTLFAEQNSAKGAGVFTPHLLGSKASKHSVPTPYSQTPNNIHIMKRKKSLENIWDTT